MSRTLTSSRNALKHGLAAQKWTKANRERISDMAKALKGDSQDSKRIEAAKRAAEAREVLERVNVARDEALQNFLDAARVDVEGGTLLDNPGQLQACSDRLDRLSRYEQQAILRWERAVAELEAVELEAD